MHDFIALLEGYYCPYPIDTLSVSFFRFLANSSIELVGSAPGESKNKTGTLYLDSAQILSIGYEIGSTYYWPRMHAINREAPTRVLSSRTDLTRYISMKALIYSFY